MSRVERNRDTYKEAAKSPSSGSAKSTRGRINWFGKLLILLGTLIMIAAIAVCLVLAVPQYANIDSYVIISGSMEPAIPVGSMVYAKECDPAEVAENEIIVFHTERTGSTPVSHRVVSNDTEKQEITTKGDANKDADPEPVSYEAVVGRVIYTVPYLGELAGPLTSTTGKVSLALFILGGFLLIESGTKMRKKK